MIDQLACELNGFINSQVSELNSVFNHPTHQLLDLAQMLGKEATHAADREAGDHVIKSRSNYTITARAVIEVVNTT